MLVWTRPLKFGLRPEDILESTHESRTQSDLGNCRSGESGHGQSLTRLAAKQDFMDVGDLAHMRTTVKQIEQLLGFAAEYEEVLRRRLDLVAARHSTLP